MVSQPLSEFGTLLDQQAGVISRGQALHCGFGAGAIGRRLRSGDWRRLQRGVYVVSRGQPTRLAMLWAAVLGAGEGAALSHQTAAELFRLTDHESSLIHVTIPASRTIAAMVEVRVHRSTRLSAAAHPGLLPPRTRIEATALDLVECSASFERAFDWACGACQRRLTTPDRPRPAMAERGKMRWRRELADVLTEIRAACTRGWNVAMSSAWSGGTGSRQQHVR